MRAGYARDLPAYESPRTSAPFVSPCMTEHTSPRYRITTPRQPNTAHLPRVTVRAATPTVTHDASSGNRRTPAATPAPLYYTTPRQLHRVRRTNLMPQLHGSRDSRVPTEQLHSDTWRPAPMLATARRRHTVRLCLGCLRCAGYVYDD